ncbi:hypothetical protein KI387_017108, partial [Taxus chinensis]
FRCASEAEAEAWRQAWQATNSSVVDDCRGVLQVYSDGSIVRSKQSGFPLPYEDDGTVVWKDL